MVLPGVTGMLLPPRAVDLLADAIAELAGDGELRERLGLAGRARFTDPFRHETMTRRLRELYERILAERRRGD